MKPILAARYQPILAAFAHDRTLVAFDFDGTLAPIADHPGAAAMRPSTAKLLSAVARRYPCVIVTGRSRRDATTRLKGVPVDIIGNHGAEPQARGVDVRRVIARARRTLGPVVARAPGAFLEDKVYSLSLHYRQSPDGPLTHAALLAAARRVPGVRIVPGKHVLNVVARGAPDKGVAVEAARRLHDCRRAIFVGDDVTDESVFREARPSRMLGIRVGSNLKSRAGFCLRRQDDIDRLLAALLRFRPGAPGAKRVTRQGSASPLGGTLEFMRLLWSLDHALQKRSKWMARRGGVTGPQRLALRLIGHMPHVSAGLLADMLKLHPEYAHRRAPAARTAGPLDQTRGSQRSPARAPGADRSRTRRCAAVASIGRERRRRSASPGWREGSRRRGGSAAVARPRTRS